MGGSKYRKEAYKVKNKTIKDQDGDENRKYKEIKYQN